MIDIVTTNEEKEVHTYEKEEVEWLDGAECVERLPCRIEEPLTWILYKFGVIEGIDA